MQKPVSKIIENLPETKPDAIQRATYEYNADPRPHKVPLHIGVVKNQNGQDIILDSIKKAESIAAKKRQGQNNYITGADTKPYQEGVKKFLFGKAKAILDRIAIADAYGGTNALFLLELFAANYFPDRVFISSLDGWPNHPNQIHFALKKQLAHYRIADNQLSYLGDPYENLVKSLGSNKIISIEQNSPHNCLGIVLDRKTWDTRLQIIKKYHGIILFDNPYCGLGKSLDDDLYPIRKAVEMGIFVMIAHSESKLKGAYDQRIGASLIVGLNKDQTAKIQGALSKIERAVQSFTTKTHLTFAELYSNQELFTLWQKEFRHKILARIVHCRKLATKYISHPQTKKILKKGRGLFATFPMSHAAATKLWQEEGIMMVKPDQKSITFDGKEVVRLNITGLQNDLKAIETIKKIDQALS